MERFNTYSVYLQLIPNSKSYTRHEDVKIKGCHEPDEYTKNKAFNESMELLKGLPLDKKVGILITRNVSGISNAGYTKGMFKKYCGSYETYNTFSHFLYDGSNWVTVEQAIKALNRIKV